MGERRVNEGGVGGGGGGGCYTESGEEDEGCSAGGKQQDGLRRGFDVCVTFQEAICSYFVQMFELHPKSTVDIVVGTSYRSWRLSRAKVTSS